MAVSSISNSIFSLISSRATDKSTVALENTQKTTGSVNKSVSSWLDKVTISPQAREAAKLGPSLLSIEAFLEGKDERVYIDVENAEAVAKKQIDAYVNVHPETPPEIAQYLYYQMRQFNICHDPVSSAYSGHDIFLSSAQKERVDYLDNKIKTDPELRAAMDKIKSRDVSVIEEIYMLVGYVPRADSAHR